MGTLNCKRYRFVMETSSDLTGKSSAIFGLLQNSSEFSEIKMFGNVRVATNF